MGGAATPMAMSELYSAIQVGVIDGAEGTLASYNDLVQYEVAPYYNYTGHLMLPDHLVISNTTLETMSAADRQALERACQASISGCYDRVRNLNTQYVARLEEKGVTFSNADVAAFRTACQDLISTAANKSSVTMAVYDLIRSEE